MDLDHALCYSQLWVWHMFCGQCLWWAMAPNKNHGSSWNTIWVLTDCMGLCQTHCRQMPYFSRAPGGGQGHMVKSQYNWLPSVPTYGSTWVVTWSHGQVLANHSHRSSSSYLRVNMGCAFAIVFSGPLPLCFYKEQVTFSAPFIGVPSLLDYTQNRPEPS